MNANLHSHTLHRPQWLALYIGARSLLTDKVHGHWFDYIRVSVDCISTARITEKLIL